MLRQSCIYIFTQGSFSTDVYLDDFYDAERQSMAGNAFATLWSIFDTLCLASLPEKYSLPVLEMVCLGILVNTKHFTLRDPELQLLELSDELHLWSASPSKNCSLCSVNFLLWLLASMQLVTLKILHNLAWWQTFLPLYNGILVIKPTNWSFADFCFTMDACLACSRATCLNKCLTFPFPDCHVSHFCSGTLHCTLRTVGTLSLSH